MVDRNLYNEDELRAPEWMNDAFFVKVLQNCENVAEVKVKNFEVTPGTTKSDHYASIMFRAKVHYTLHGVDTLKFQSMIIKTMPTIEGQKMDVLGEMQIFETEIKMYMETLPKMEKILNQYGDYTKLCARCLYHSLTPCKLIVFEDLVQLGFETISNRTTNLEEVRAALLNVAKLHAVSYKLAQMGDRSITSYNSNFFAGGSMRGMEICTNAVKLLMEICEKHADLKAFIPHLARIDEKLLDNLITEYNTYHNTPDAKGIFVLNHGDFHMKNMMVKKTSKGVLDEIMLLDYQMSFFGSSAIDILYATVMLMNADMRRHQREELIYYYFTNFQKTLQLIEFSGKIPTMTEFQIELLKHKHWELFLVVGFLIINYLHADGEGDLGKAFEDETYRRKLLENSELLQELREILSQFVYRGYFEY